MRRAGIIVTAVVIALPALAQFDFVPDVPTDLSGSTFLPWEIVLRDAGAYASTLVLPGNPPVDALHRMDSGHWLISVDAPTTLGGISYDPRDLIRYDGAGYSLFLDGAASGIPAGANVDALFLEGGDAGDPVLSFDVPTTIGGTTYQPGDLVRVSGGSFSLDFDGAAAGIPAASNVVGADRRGGNTVLTFDVPTDLGATTYLPGDLVAWDGTSFSLLHRDPGWPSGSGIVGVSLRAAAAFPGVIPPTLVLGKVSSTVVRLTWQPSCAAGAADYGIYEGAIGAWYSHAPIDCSDDGADFSENVTPAAGHRYFLVVPHDAAGREGSYGRNSAGSERPVGAGVCQAAQRLGGCP